MYRFCSNSSSPPPNQVSRGKKGPSPTSGMKESSGWTDLRGSGAEVHEGSPSPNRPVAFPLYSNGFKLHFRQDGSKRLGRWPGAFM